MRLLSRSCSILVLSLGCSGVARHPVEQAGAPILGATLFGGLRVDLGDTVAPTPDSTALLRPGRLAGRDAVQQLLYFRGIIDPSKPDTIVLYRRLGGPVRIIAVRFASDNAWQTVAARYLDLLGAPQDSTAERLLWASQYRSLVLEAPRQRSGTKLALEYPMSPPSVVHSVPTEFWELCMSGTPELCTRSDF